MSSPFENGRLIWRSGEMTYLHPVTIKKGSFDHILRNISGLTVQTCNISIVGVSLLLELLDVKGVFLQALILAM